MGETLTLGLSLIVDAKGETPRSKSSDWCLLFEVGDAAIPRGVLRSILRVNEGGGVERRLESWQGETRVLNSSVGRSAEDLPRESGPCIFVSMPNNRSHAP